MAARVHAYVEEQKTRDPEYSVRKFSLECGWDGSHLGTVLRRMQLGKDQRGETLRTIAKQMGKPLSWLETGEMPEGYRLDEAPEWAVAVAAAIVRYKLDPALLAAMGASRLPYPPKHLDEHVLEKFMHFWRDAMR